MLTTFGTLKLDFIANVCFNCLFFAIYFAIKLKMNLNNQTGNPNQGLFRITVRRFINSIRNKNEAISNPRFEIEFPTF